MQLIQPLFATSLADSNVMTTIEAIGVKNPKTEKDCELLFGPNTGNK